MNAREFAEAYALRSGLTLAEFADLLGDRREVRECHCGDDTCEGWQMAHCDSRELWEKPGTSLADLVKSS